MALLGATDRTAPVRVLVDGVGSGELADALVEGLRAAGRPPLRVSGRMFLRPAGERFEHGREDVQSLLETWLDVDALRREVLDAARTDRRWLPALRDPDLDRSARAATQPVPEGAVVVVDGLFLLGHAVDGRLPAELTVHVTRSLAALRRAGVPVWQLPAFAAYDLDVRPGAVCDVLVRSEDPRRPAILVRRRP